MITIVIPVYNTAAYLGETIDSILHQTLPFRDHVTLHLIDDASSDDSLSICQDYGERYPEQIKVTHFETNRGVSAARNYGVAMARKEQCGGIVGFVDSDDRLEEDALGKVLDFFERHGDVNMAVLEVYFFGATEKPHKLNWRFEEREVVNIREDYTYPQYYIGGAFFRKNVLDKLRFDETMCFWEDALAINQMILSEEKYGLVRGAVYYYRRRSDKTSLVDRAWYDKGRYLPFLDNGYLRLMKYCRREKWRILPYIQYVVAYHMHLFFLKSNDDAIRAMMNEAELKLFRKKLHGILRKVRADVIIRIPTSLPIIEMMLTIRRGRKTRSQHFYTENDCIFSYHGYEITRMSEQKVYLSRIIDEPGEYQGMWWGMFDTPAYQMSEEDYIYAEHGGERVDSVRYPCSKKRYVLGERIRNYRYAGFAIAIPPKWKRARFGLHTKGIDIPLNEVVFKKILAMRREEGLGTP